MSPRRLRLPPVQHLLAAGCLVAALVLASSEFMTTFEFTPPGGEPLQASEASERHAYALVVLAAFAIGSLALALLTGSKPAATGVAVAGVMALLIFLLTDLPDAGQIGTLDDPRQSFIDAEAVPQAGFWMELLGSLSLAVSGIAFATLVPEQIGIFVAARERRAERREAASATANPGDEPGRPGADESGRPGASGSREPDEREARQRARRRRERRERSH